MKWMLGFVVSLVATIVALGTPNVAKAEDGTKVHITNSASNPAVTQDVGQSASQMMYLSCFDYECYELEASAPYTVPAGRQLVITAVDVTSTFPAEPVATPCYSSQAVTLFGTNISSGYSINTWLVGANSPTMHFTYPPGFAVPLGLTLNLTQAGKGSCYVTARLFGYLTAN